MGDRGVLFVVLVVDRLEERLSLVVDVWLFCRTAGR